MSMETNESYVSLRLATKEDVPHIMKLIHQMAEFERLTHICVATEASLESTLFDAPPFQGPTIILLQISPALPKQNNINPNESLEISVQKLGMNPPVNDPQAEDFVSALGNGTTVAGFVIFFRNYSTFLAKPGFYIEEIFVREPYRRRGLGTILLKAVAGKAVELGFGRVEWTVLDWNGSAIQFYEKMEAQVLPDWRLCRLTGKALEDCWH